MDEERFTYKLLVEGNDDVHVVRALWNSQSKPELFDIIDCKSKDRVLNELKIRLTTPQNHRVIGVILDADTDASACWDAIKSRLNATGKYNSRKLKLSTNGLILEATDPEFPKIGVWIMPDNNLPGMLEDFLAALSEPEDPLMLKAEEVLSDLENQGINKYKNVHRAKAKIHTFLAWQDEPGKPMGTAITTRILDPTKSNAKVFIAWLERLFQS